MHGDFLFQAFVYLAAAVVSVPIAKRAGLGSVLGYLVAGAVIGPYVLGLVGAGEGEDVMHFAEFGVVMMLFVVGLELRPSLLWKMRGPIFGVGGMQVLTTTAVITGIAVLGFGMPARQGLAVGMVLALSSTAIVLQTLAEKGLLDSDGGRSSFAVLLFQDIAVIPMLALLPILGSAAAIDRERPADAGDVASLLEGLAGWEHALVVLAAVSSVVVIGRLVMGRFFRFIATSRLPEVFTAAALLLVVGIALLMRSVGLSPALGTFLAGVVLAESEYRHELEADIAPFKGLLLGLFFLAVGASIDFPLLGQQPGLIFGLTAMLILVKLGILFGLSRIRRMTPGEGLLFTFSLAQGGEFAFVLFSFAQQEGVLGTDVVAPLTAVVAFSMAATPLCMLVQERVLQPRLIGEKSDGTRAPDVVDEHNRVLMAGYGRFGHVIALILRGAGFDVTVLDLDEKHIDVLRRVGAKVFYGDATRVDLLEAAGAADAEIFVCAIDDPDKAIALVKTVRSHFPHLQVLARARGRPHGYEMIRAGAHLVERETLGSSLEVASAALTALGLPANQAWRLVRRFRRHDQRYVREMLEVWGDDKVYFDRARSRIAELERLMAADLGVGLPQEIDKNWESARVVKRRQP